MYTIKEIMERYSVKRETVLGWIHSGELEAMNVARFPDSGRPTWRVTREALERFEANRKRSSRKEPVLHNLSGH